MKTGMIILSAVMGLFLASCNTFSGVGKDVESLGNNIDKAAVKTKTAIDR